MSDLDEDVERYATLAVQLAAPDADREALLAAHGLDEQRYGELEDRWMNKLSLAEDAPGDGVPPLLVQYATAFSRAQRALGGTTLLTLERYAAITRALSRGRDVAQVLEKQGLSLGDYLRSHEHWTRQLASDGALAQRFRKLLLG